MTHRAHGAVFIMPEPEGVCEFCGNTDELRPYGPKGERICFDCGMKDPSTTALMFQKVLDGEH